MGGFSKLLGLMDRPIYQGELGPDDKLRYCRCGELASYDASVVIDGQEHTFDVCNVHFRRLSRQGDGRLKAGNEFPEYTRHIQRIRVWVKHYV